ncbi:unnamed protein product [Trichogramma brassicae]|uniref:Uncharacterized protein n=1 Tax=Trichogramma brassicae TaxID=86971 RepID=A0A6H5IWE1_9HYME|nr:unnamed protein product [Trichogramma brassicae]
MEELKRLRCTALDLGNQDDRREFLRKLYPLIENWNGEIPDLRRMFKAKDINRLFIEDVFCENKKAPFVGFAITAEYKDEPDSEICEDWEWPSPKRTTAIHHVAKRSSPDMALIQKLFDIYDRYDYADEETGLTHLHVACMSAALTPYAAMFLNLGQSNPNCPVRDTGDTPLHYAARHRNQEAVSLLLRHGAEPTWANYEGLSPLHLLCQVDDDDDGGDHARLREFFRVCEDVVEKPLYLDPRDIRGNTPLHVALRSGSKRAAKLMLAKGADPLLPNEENLTPLQMAIDLGDRDFAQTFYEICVVQGRIDDPNLANYNKNININNSNNNNSNNNNNDNSNDEKEDIFFKIDEVNRKRLESLHVAIVSHDMILVDRLVKEGANPNARDSMGRTPLHVICQVDGNGASSSLIESLAQLFFETCDEVKQQQLEIDARDVDGLTPLQWAVARLLPETVELLLQRGADLANFVFPPREAVFYDDVRGSDYCDVEALAEIAACAADICDSLERRGYKMKDRDVVTLMKRLAQYGLFAEGNSRQLDESEEYRRHEARLRRLFWPCVLKTFLKKRMYRLPIDRTCEELEATRCADLWSIFCEDVGLKKH